MFKPKAKYKPGDLVVFNKSRNFGNREDELFHIHSINTKKQHYYSGYLFTIGEYESKGLPKIPVFSTTLTNAPEENLKGLAHLALKK